MMDKTRQMRYAKPAAWSPWAARGRGLMVYRLAAALLAVLLGLAGIELPVARAASSIPLFTGPQDPSQLFAYLNALVVSINTITVPLLPNVPGGVNQISLVPAVTGQPAQIALQPGSDPNGGIQINPNGSGDIILFSQGDTGNLVIANQSSFVAANGLAPCPGTIPGNPPLGMQGVVSGYFIFEDWLDRNQYSLNCK